MEMEEVHMLFRRKRVEKVPTALDMAREEFFAAVAERNRILENFDNVLPEFFDIANAELTAATMAVDVCTKKVKMLEATL
jgi:hypothetical protein